LNGDGRKRHGGAQGKSGKTKFHGNCPLKSVRPAMPRPVFPRGCALPSCGLILSVFPG
jgi:hypothetical protein